MGSPEIGKSKRSCTSRTCSAVRRCPSGRKSDVIVHSTKPKSLACGSALQLSKKADVKIDAKSLIRPPPNLTCPKSQNVPQNSASRRMCHAAPPRRGAAAQIGQGHMIYDHIELSHLSTCWPAS